MSSGPYGYDMESWLKFSEHQKYDISQRVAHEMRAKAQHTASLPTQEELKELSKLHSDYRLMNLKWNKRRKELLKPVDELKKAALLQLELEFPFRNELRDNLNQIRYKIRAKGRYISDFMIHYIGEKA